MAISDNFYRLSKKQLEALADAIDVHGGPVAIATATPDVIDNFVVETVSGAPMATLGDIRSVAAANTATDRYIFVITTGDHNPVSTIDMVDLIRDLETYYAKLQTQITNVVFRYLAL